MPIEGYIIEKMDLDTGAWVPAGEVSLVSLSSHGAQVLWPSDITRLLSGCSEVSWWSGLLPFWSYKSQRLWGSFKVGLHVRVHLTQEQ